MGLSGVKPDNGLTSNSVKITEEYLVGLTYVVYHTTYIPLCKITSPSKFRTTLQFSLNFQNIFFSINNLLFNNTKIFGL